MARPLLSIIVPIYKVEKYLEKCILSILGQTFSDFELILVDDGSPDRCPEICDYFGKKDKRIKVIHKSNGGLSDARNAGLQYASGFYLGFVDGDDFIAPQMYERLVFEMQKNESDLVFCDYYRVSTKNTQIEKFFKESRHFSREEALRLILADQISSHAWNKLFKRDIFADLRFPVGRIYEDIPTIFKYVHLCRKVYYCAEPLYYYTIREDGISLSSGPKRSFDIFLGYKERYEFVKKEFPKCHNECLKLALTHGLLACYYSSLNYEIEKFRSLQKFLVPLRHDVLSNPHIAIKQKFIFLIVLYADFLYHMMVKLHHFSK